MGTHLKSKLAIALAVLLLCTATAFATLQLPRHTEGFYVNDFANVLSDETERYIMETSRAYDRSDGTQVVVATIPTLAGASIEEYALELARSWGVGGAETDNGLLVLLAVEDREIRVEIGYGLEGIFNDAKTGRFIRNDATPYLSQNQWDQGILALYNALLGELQNPTPLPPQEEEGGGSFAVALLIVLALLVIFGRAGGPPGIWMHRPRFPGGGFGGGMGGFGGGGGGGFSGGGGGFGGGGASGKF